MDQPSYYSILTADVRYDENLTFAEKVLFSEITALSNKYGYCTALNNYFSELYHVSTKSISRWLSDLEKYQYIVRDVKRNSNNQVIARKIYPVSVRGEVWTKLSGGYGQNCLNPMDKNGKDNITRDNNTRLNNISASSDAGVSEKVDKSKKTKEKDTQIAKDFEEIWAIYPRKIGKKEAFRHYKAWLKQSKSNTKEVMLEKVKAFAKYILLKGTVKDYVPYGSTWFSSRVDDDYSTDAEQGSQPTSGGYDNANSLLNNLDDDDLPF